jgi:Trk-type K+ transport system membrane component
MLLVQIGGLGIMTLTSFVVIAVARRLDLRSRLIVQLESSARDLSSVRRIVLAVIGLSLVFEAVIALVLTLRFRFGWDMELGSAVYHGVFHAVTAFNNAGFALYSDNLARFVTDGWISVTVALGIIAGGLGFPVWLELRRAPVSWGRWSLHTKLTLVVTGFLLLIGFVTVLGFEWSNDATLGALSTPGKLLAAFFQGVTPRTAGFNTIDYAQVRDETLLSQDFLMFVGTGSASTGGGIKVTTLALLSLMVWAELRGDPEVNAFGRRVPAALQRQALAIGLVALGAVVGATLVLMADSGHGLSGTLFEVISAFGTVGLSTGLTDDWSTLGLGVLIGLMFLGRVGPHTIGVALALRERPRRIRYAEEEPIIG